METTKIGPRSPWLSMMDLAFILGVTKLANTAAIIPAMKPINKHAPMF